VFAFYVFTGLLFQHCQTLVPFQRIAHCSALFVPNKRVFIYDENGSAKKTLNIVTHDQRGGDRKPATGTFMRETPRPFETELFASCSTHWARALQLFCGGTTTFIRERES